MSAAARVFAVIVALDVIAVVVLCLAARRPSDPARADDVTETVQFLRSSRSQ